MAKTVTDGKSMRKEMADLEAMTQKLKRQFESHLFCLETKAQNKIDILQEWHEYLKRRSEIEVEYTRAMDRLTDRFLERVNRMKNPPKGKGNEPTSPSSTSLDLLHGILADTKVMAQGRTAYVEQFSSEVLSRIDVLNRDTNLVSKKVRDVSVTMHDEMLKAYRELVDACRFYHQMATATQDSQQKLQKIKAPKKKSEKEKSEKERKKEMKALEQLMINKRRMIRARNDYLLTMRGANVLTKRYFGKSLIDLFEYADYDFQWSVGKIYCVQAEAEQGLALLQQSAVETCLHRANLLDMKTDRDRFLTEFSNYFMPPPEFQFLAYGQKELAELTVIDGVHDDLKKQRSELFTKISAYTMQVDEEHKTLECIKENLRADQAITMGVGDSTKEPASPGHDTRRDSITFAALRERPLRQSSSNIKSSVMSERKEHMDFLFNVFQRICQHSAELDRRTAQHDMMDDALRDLTVDQVHKNTQAAIQETLEINRMRRQEQGLPKLFQGNIDLYLAATGHTIPVIITSCIDYISKKGTTTEGVFRVPGPAQEIEDLKAAFEKGVDPLVSVHLYDIHAVASLLKQYFRELAEPIFPYSFYPTLMRIQHSNYDPVSKKDALISGIISRLGPNRVTVLRVLFRFLHKFAEYSAHTKMNLSNLALVFGPTLMRAPEGTDPLALAQEMQTVNSICLFMLDYHADLFGADSSEEEIQEGGDVSLSPTPTDDPISGLTGGQSIPEPPPMTDELTVNEEAEAEEVNGQDKSDDMLLAAYNRISGVHILDDEGSESSGTDTEPEEEQHFVRALHSYSARNDKELSFKKGEIIEVICLTDDKNWWDSVIDERRGYIPASYVQEFQPEPEQTSLSTEHTHSTTSASLELVPETEEVAVAPQEHHVQEQQEVTTRDTLAVTNEEDRRRSQGDAPHGTSAVTSPMSAGTTTSLDRMQARTAMFNTPAPTAPKPARPPIKSKPNKMQMSNFQQLEGIVGRGSGRPIARPPVQQPQ